MRKNKAYIFLLFSAFILQISCSKRKIEKCNFAPEIITNISTSHPCSSTGSIIITSPIEDNYTYRIDQSNFQSSPVFEKISVGHHTLYIKNDLGCESSKLVIIDTLKKSNKFIEVSAILKSRCSSCHSGLNPHAGIDFTRTCDILKHWHRIQARAVEGNPSPMPPTGLISVAERQKLVEWINSGHTFD